MDSEEPVYHFGAHVFGEPASLVLHVKGVRHGQLLFDLHVSLDLTAVFRHMIYVAKGGFIDS